MPIDKDRFFPAAFGSYGSRLRELVNSYREPHVLELGGGRSPSFSPESISSSMASYTVNDISDAELSLLSPGYEKARFDVTGDVSPYAGRYDVIFSRTLAEHVKDGRAMHGNVLTLLKPGGVAFHMMPTLYSSPFVLNRLLPDTLSRRIVHAVLPRRRSVEPKFPAHYSWCFGSREKMARMLRLLGYSDVRIRTFYGHDYYKKLPGLRELDRAFATMAAKNDWSSYGSYAHVIAYK